MSVQHRHLELFNRLARGRPARLLGVAGVLFSLALTASRCVWTAGEAELVDGHAVVRVEALPPDIHAYPRVYYHGGYAYLVGDRWYYDSPRGWVIFRSEPRVLAERRIYVRRSHERPHHHERHHHRERPRYHDERRAPAYREAPVERRRRYYAD
ncbi:hypothetical protein [Sorangium sp. So ce854]|uniref:hypothetical protein n=1 Tax=Sorangium sp. So ce854 TaxID=3133322 RepID=UPI003F6452DC